MNVGGRLGTLGAFRHDQFRLLFAGLVAANLGTWMQQFAVGWLVVQLAVRDGTPELAGLYLGLRSIASALPALAFGLFAGVYADRMDRRHLLIVARVASAGVAIALALMVLTDRADIATVMVLSAASSAAFAFDPPGRQAVLPNVVPARDLFSAMGLSRASMQLAHTLGPLIAGVLVIPVGVGGVLLAKAALDVGSVSVMRRLRPQPPTSAARSIGVLGSLREGLAHMRGDRLIRWCVTLQLVFALLVQSFMQLLPALAVESLGVGAVELSWLVAAAGAGALIGAVFVASSGSVERRGLLLLAAMLAAGAMLTLLSVQRQVLGAIIVLGLLGILQQTFLGTQSVILQLAAPDRLRGRIMGMQSVIFMSAGPFGVLGLGILGTFIGIAATFLVAGLAVSGIALIVALRVDLVRDLRAASAASRPTLVGTSPAEMAD